KAESYMKEYEDEYISMEHILRSAMDIDQTTKHYINNKVEVIKEIIKKVRGGNHVTSQNPEVNYEALAKYGRDLVEEVRQGKMDPVIG
ncbi:ATP-dependent chaperone ClpB, partial [Staphylococcus pseudintermedius]